MKTKEKKLITVKKLNNKWKLIFFECFSSALECARMLARLHLTEECTRQISSLNPSSFTVRLKCLFIPPAWAVEKKKKEVYSSHRSRIRNCYSSGRIEPHQLSRIVTSLIVPNEPSRKWRWKKVGNMQRRGMHIQAPRVNMTYRVYVLMRLSVRTLRPITRFWIIIKQFFASGGEENKKSGETYIPSGRRSFFFFLFSTCRLSEKTSRLKLIDSDAAYVLPLEGPSFRASGVASSLQGLFLLLHGLVSSLFFFDKFLNLQASWKTN